ncbi:MAG: transposase [Chlamydiae bacterium]|nr:transposase [Chlamydiota bacterium]
MATLSDGVVFLPSNSFKKKQAVLARAQRAVSRKKKFSNNWKRAQKKVQRLHREIAAIRHDHLHKTTTTISKNHAVVCVEDLQVKNMSKSASGTIASPCKNVRAKSGLNRSILDQGWGEFRRQLEYKQAWRGGEVIAVSPANTSRTCLECGHVSQDNRQTQSEFLCVRCCYAANADWVGSVNILRAGHARLACRETSPEVGASAQEPIEATMYELACA